MRKPIRILQFPGAMLFGGVGSVVMNLYRNIDKTKIQFDFCVPRNSRGPLDDEIESMGGGYFIFPKCEKRGLDNMLQAYVGLFVKMVHICMHIYILFIWVQ